MLSNSEMLPRRLGFRYLCVYSTLSLIKMPLISSTSKVWLAGHMKINCDLPLISDCVYLFRVVFVISCKFNSWYCCLFRFIACRGDPTRAECCGRILTGRRKGRRSNKLSKCFRDSVSIRKKCKRFLGQLICTCMPFAFCRDCLFIIFQQLETLSKSIIFWLGQVVLELVSFVQVIYTGYTVFSPINKLKKLFSPLNKSWSNSHSVWIIDFKLLRKKWRAKRGKKHFAKVKHFINIAMLFSFSLDSTFV